jgi:hypothetical protein
LRFSKKRENSKGKIDFPEKNEKTKIAWLWGGRFDDFQRDSENFKEKLVFPFVFVLLLL